MVICPLCGNCTNNNTCEVCGMKLFNENAPGNDFNTYDKTEEKYSEKEISKKASFHMTTSSPPPY